MKKRKPRGYWHQWENVENEVKKIIQSLDGEFPTSFMLRKMRRHMVMYGIRLHGGPDHVRKKMNYKPVPLKPNGYWKQWKNFKSELELAITYNNGIFPSYSHLVNMRRLDITNAIKYYGGYDVVRERMGFKPKNSKRDGYWISWNNITNELQVAIKQNNGDFPSNPQLNKMRKSNLGIAITRYHGGFPIVRERIGYNQQKREELAQKLEEIVQSLL